MISKLASDEIAPSEPSVYQMSESFSPVRRSKRERKERNISSPPEEKVEFGDKKKAKRPPVPKGFESEAE